MQNPRTKVFFRRNDSLAVGPEVPASTDIGIDLSGVTAKPEIDSLPFRQENRSCRVRVRGEP